MRTPQWATPHEVVARSPIARLLDFSGTDTGSGGTAHTPTLFVPPQAGHSSCIVDLTDTGSQIRAAQAAGLSGVHSLDWIGATGDTKHASIDDHLAALASAVQRLGGRANLVGCSQGGWLATIYAARHPGTVNTLTVVGAPTDFHAARALPAAWLRLLAPLTNLAAHRALVAACGDVLPGELAALALSASQPEGELVRWLQLLVHADDVDQVARHRAFERWRAHPQPIAGAFYLWMLEHLFQNNELARGALVVDGHLIELGAISCPLFLLAGVGDQIAPAAQVFALAEQVASPAADIRRRTARCGHLDLWTDPDVLHRQWVPLLREVAARSV
jgi:poly(3-hydroxyalkanoate) synthetase